MYKSRQKFIPEFGCSLHNNVRQLSSTTKRPDLWKFETDKTSSNIFREYIHYYKVLMAPSEWNNDPEVGPNQPAMFNSGQNFTFNKKVNTEFVSFFKI